MTGICKADCNFSVFALYSCTGKGSGVNALAFEAVVTPQRPAHNGVICLCFRACLGIVQLVRMSAYAKVKLAVCRFIQRGRPFGKSLVICKRERHMRKQESILTVLAEIVKSFKPGNLFAADKFKVRRRTNEKVIVSHIVVCVQNHKIYSTKRNGVVKITVVAAYIPMKFVGIFAHAVVVTARKNYRYLPACNVACKLVNQRNLVVRGDVVYVVSVKNEYVEPEISVVDMEVEAGFAASTPDLFYDEQDVDWI